MVGHRCGHRQRRHPVQEIRLRHHQPAALERNRDSRQRRQRLALDVFATRQPDRAQRAGRYGRDMGGAEPRHRGVRVQSLQSDPVSRRHRRRARHQLLGRREGYERLPAGGSEVRAVQPPAARQPRRALREDEAKLDRLDLDRQRDHRHFPTQYRRSLLQRRPAVAEPGSRCDR